MSATMNPNGCSDNNCKFGCVDHVRQHRGTVVTSDKVVEVRGHDEVEVAVTVHRDDIKNIRTKVLKLNLLRAPADSVFQQSRTVSYAIYQKVVKARRDEFAAQFSEVYTRYYTPSDKPNEKIDSLFGTHTSPILLGMMLGVHVEALRLRISPSTGQRVLSMLDEYAITRRVSAVDILKAYSPSMSYVFVNALMVYIARDKYPAIESTPLDYAVNQAMSG